MLTTLKRSAEYRRVRPRLRGERPHPVLAAWRDGGRHVFAFALSSSGRDPGDGRVVFAMHPTDPAPLAVVTVVPTGAHVVVTDLRPPFSTTTAPRRR